MGNAQTAVLPPNEDDEKKARLFVEI